METHSLSIIIAIIILYIFIAAFFLSIYMPKRAKRIKRAAHLVPLNKRLMSIDDPKKLGEALDKLTDKQFKEYQEWFKRDTYRIDSLGYYLSDRFDKMKPGDCRRTFILNIVSKFKLENQFGYKRNRGKIR